jgi:hypothetical protein
VGVEFSVRSPVNGGSGEAGEDSEVGDALGNEFYRMLMDVPKRGSQPTSSQAIPEGIASII